MSNALFVRLMWAAIMPSIALLSMCRWKQGVVCAFLQISKVGWVVASIWAIIVTINYSCCN